ncbi:acyl-CoA dehydrogenase family protein [Gordonia sp. NB41Y]|uniref:acyl-CoA dehydrogenase family protein n=1 Tax=Gordonia sp. NB41Y TaxID=875808 RepID=UPI0006B16E96|nr:acyl-CoA dehydrogenase family protein [Gordonia sp. NB41Y]EMP11871.2 acyl-CoA dehydrogenase [Gordonia sp. NB41Y]WLP88581.1 acyl-CoA dehydrogenase family protein [Gordonia sp. NB41Y]
MTTRPTVDPDLVAMMSAVFAEYRRTHAPTTGIALWDTGLWTRLEELGLVRLTGDEQAGGSGAGWFEAAELIRSAVWHGVHIPLAEHDLLAGWLLESAGLDAGPARRTFCVLDEFGVARAVPWASSAEKIVTVWRDRDRFVVADVDASALGMSSGANLAGEPRDTVTAEVSSLSGIPVADTVIDQMMLRGALIRALQVCAALDRIVELSVTHTTDRTQFGRPLAKFQSVQNLVADMAAEAALARAATDGALAEAVDTDWSGSGLEFRVAVARSCAGHAASVVVRNAHQVHGAIGTTMEHRLHEFTKPALAWRSEFGSVHHWDQLITTAAIAAGRDGLWPLITG